MNLLMYNRVKITREVIIGEGIKCQQFIRRKTHHSLPKMYEQLGNKLTAYEIARNRILGSDVLHNVGSYII